MKLPLILLLAVSPIAEAIKLTRVARSRVQAITSGSSGSPSSLSLMNIRNVEYVGEISVGTPRQTFYVVFDTGSPYLWITDKSCDKTCGIGRLFDSSQSSTFKPSSGPAFNISYLSGTSSGLVGSDTVQLGSFILPNVSFGAVNTDSAGIKSMGADGIIGLSKVGDNDIFPPLFYSMIDLKLVQEPIFSMWLGDESEGGDIVFGEIDHSRYLGPLQYVKSFQGLFWMMKMTRLEITKGDKFSGTVPAVLDSGTTVLMLPSVCVQSYMELHANMISLTRQGYYVLDSCSYVKKLQNISLELSGMTFTLRGKDMVTRLKMGDWEVCLLLLEGSNDHIILGEPFLRRYYTVYNVQNGDIGIALSNGTVNTNSIDDYEDDEGERNVVNPPSADSNGRRISGTLHYFIMVTFFLMMQ